MEREREGRDIQLVAIWKLQSLCWTKTKCKMKANVAPYVSDLQINKDLLTCSPCRLYEAIVQYGSVVFMMFCGVSCCISFINPALFHLLPSPVCLLLTPPAPRPLVSLDCIEVQSLLSFPDPAVALPLCLPVL